MRIWTIHPKYLDSKGLVALWRETLLAKKVLQGLTKGYKNHPQLNRFKETENPILAINTYLNNVYIESQRRGYSFESKKIGEVDQDIKIKVTRGQVAYEFEHLLKKLTVRDLEKYEKIKDEKDIEVNPLFQVQEGEIEGWEITDNYKT